MNKKLLTLYSLKFNPFSPQVPATRPLGLPAIESFCWRIEQQVGEGGFALVVGEPGTGKSAALRILAERLGNCAICPWASSPGRRPPWPTSTANWAISSACPCRPHNRWTSAKVLREKWLPHIETALYRPVLLIDEAQEMNTAVFSELRLLASADLDSRSILTIILAGDRRLATAWKSPTSCPSPVAFAAACAWKPWPPKQLLDMPQPPAQSRRQPQAA